MWYLLIRNNYYPKEISRNTLEKLIKNKEKIKLDQRTVFKRMKNGILMVFIPILQWGKTVLKYNCNLGHTCSDNLHFFFVTCLKAKYVQ